ncbi:MAG: alpha/beta fold hydrolase [Gammaproteobacteria bacterium]
MTRSRPRLLGLLLIILLAAVWVLLPEVAYRAVAGAERTYSGVYRAELDLDGRTIAYLEGGQGPNLLLLHGFGSNKDTWNRMSRLLTPDFHVVAPDLPGFGESDLADGTDYSVPAQVERVRAFADALGLTRFYVGGSSMGGNIAGAFAARYPEMVEGLWMISPLGVAGAEPSEMDRITIEQGESPLIIEQPSEFKLLLKLAFEDKPWIPKPVIHHHAQEAAARYNHYHWIYGQLHIDGPQGTRPVTPLQPLIAGTSVPTLIHWGEKDRILDVSGAYLLVDAIPSAELLIMPDVGHMTMMERPEESVDSFARFAGKNGTTSGENAGEVDTTP